MREAPAHEPRYVVSLNLAKCIGCLLRKMDEISLREWSHHSKALDAYIENKWSQFASTKHINFEDLENVNPPHHWEI